MSLLEKQFSVFFNSSVANGSTKIGKLGNHFQVQLQSPLNIPNDCVYATLEVVSAKVWNTSPNISEEIGNNHLFFRLNSKEYDILFEDGIWGVEEMNMWLEFSLVRWKLAKDLFELETDDATQKVSIKINNVGVVIDFTKPKSVIDVMGFYTEHNEFLDTFSSDLILSTTIVGDSFIAPNEARFNRVINFYIKSNLVSDGIPVNNQSSGIIAEVPINVKVGSLINYVPQIPLRVDCSDLIGNSKQSITFQLVDQQNRGVSTSGEDFSMALVFRYWGWTNQ
jgi:hypothetical protein